MYLQIKKYAPGLAMAFLIAVISVFSGNRIPILGSSIIALLIGMTINPLVKLEQFEVGLKFVSKRLLQLAIILLGTNLSLVQVFTVGRISLFVMVFTLSAAFLSAYLVGKLLNMNWKLSSLIGAGTGICGGSAIVALSPIVEADEMDIAYAISATFIFDVLMIVLFPILGQVLNLSDIAYGLWTGTAVNDTSSVVAAGYAFSEAAGNYATIVKLTRTTAIIPITLIFSIFIGYRNAKLEKQVDKKAPNIKGIFPWFILIFIGSVLLNTIGIISVETGMFFSRTSKFMMAMALAAVGLKTNLKLMLSSGIKPMTLGFIVSTVVVIVSITVQYFNGQV
ncbi:putative sulfate exporter family transporter [Serpentinicella sp. ANB-PHB4]|uniref:YeiH family protein n=1 Tax=Serpentinicella sp. ANB-PHB4 TaxID=3074076 RepID=UPI0028592B5E|nr:putative sulfate exporter family transporter [Serpentinicella sp. ANB-PHB4]MDR5658510.1 putative sulfate exporter family transporter [Serpentinicella sp. ANB-PHB4]